MLAAILKLEQWILFSFSYYTSKYFLIEITLPRIPIPIPSNKYTVITNANTSEKVNKLIPICVAIVDVNIFPTIKL